MSGAEKTSSLVGLNDTIYDSSPELRSPERFLSSALNDLRRSPAVAWPLFRRGLRTRYRRSWLGYLWLLLPMVGTTLVWMYVQSRQIVAIAPTGAPYPVFVLVGMVLWQVFVDSINVPLQQLEAGRQLITRSRVPHEALVMAGLLEVWFNAVIRFAVVLPALLLLGSVVEPSAVMAPLGLVALSLLGLTLGLAAAPFGLLYEDVGRALVVLTGFWFFLTPVIYPFQPRGLMQMNPVAPLLETTRAWLIGGEGAGGVLPVIVATLPFLVIAWLFHRLARPHLVSRLG